MANVSPDRLKGFLDDLALISAKHGLFVTAHDMWAHDLEPGFVGYAGCAHHGDPATDSMNIRPLIPRRSGHWFHEHPATLA